MRVSSILAVKLGTKAINRAYDTAQSDFENLSATIIPTIEGRTYWEFSVSPQGSSIAYVGAQFREVWVMGTNGENPKQVLSSEKDTYHAAVAWSPTGNRLVYTKVTRGRNAPSIETLALDGGRRAW